MVNDRCGDEIVRVDGDGRTAACTLEIAAVATQNNQIGVVVLCKVQCGAHVLDPGEVVRLAFRALGSGPSLVQRVSGISFVLSTDADPGE